MSKIYESEETEITTHKIIPNNKGFTPADLILLMVKPAPIKNKHTTNNRFETTNIP